MKMPDDLDCLPGRDGAHRYHVAVDKVHDHVGDHDQKNVVK